MVHYTARCLVEQNYIIEGSISWQIRFHFNKAHRRLWRLSHYYDLLRRLPLNFIFLWVLRTKPCNVFTTKTHPWWSNQIIYNRVLNDKRRCLLLIKLLIHSFYLLLKPLFPRKLILLESIVVQGRHRKSFILKTLLLFFCLIFGLDLGGNWLIICRRIWLLKFERRINFRRYSLCLPFELDVDYSQMRF